MASKRYQKGTVYQRGKDLLWKGRWYEDVVAADGDVIRVRKEVTLGTPEEIRSKKMAQRRLDVILARINDCSYRPGRTATFAQFIERWVKEVLPMQEPSSVAAVKSHIRCYILPILGKVEMNDFGPENQQKFIGYLM